MKKCIPSMEQCNMYNCSSKCSKTKTISHGKKNAQVKRPFPLVGSNVNVEIRVNDGCDVVFSTSCCEKLVGKYRKRFRVVDIEPIA